MRMNLLLLLFTLQGFNLLHAQSSPGSTPAPVQTSEETLKVYPLLHSNCSSALESLRVLGPSCTIVGDFRTNSLVIRATQQTHKEIQQLLKIIDSPETARGETEMIEVSKVAKENEPLLLKYANMNEIQIALKDGFLVAKGQHDSIERLRAFVEVLKKHRQEVAQKQRNFSLRVLWLSNDPDHDALNKTETDEALKKAIEKLAELGYEKMQVRMILLGRCDSLSSQRTTCQVDGTLDFGTMRHTLQVLGDFSNDGNPKLEGQLELEAVVSRRDSNPAKTSVKVGVQVEPKKYYILSAGPIGGFQSAFVVQLTENP